MIEILDRPLAKVAEALRERELSALELAEEAIRRHETTGSSHHAYKHWDPAGTREAARSADERLASDPAPRPSAGSQSR